MVYELSGLTCKYKTYGIVFECGSMFVYGAFYKAFEVSATTKYGK